LGDGILTDRDLAFRHFPVIAFDRMEPFLPSRVGYSIFRSPSDSRADYKRKLSTSSAIAFGLAGLDCVIEYGIWWDWDIEHLYELEAVWIYLGGSGEYIRVEASWHGRYNAMLAEGKIPIRDGRPLLFSQPGKHAFAASPEAFKPEEEYAAPCSSEAGSTGLLVTPLFEGRIAKNPDRDRLAQEYLKAKAFIPSFEFVKEWRMPREGFLPWDTLEEWIPVRIEEILSRLAGGRRP